MAIQRLVLDSIPEDDFELIAIHSSLPPYRLAFLLNKNLEIRLARKKKDVLLKTNEIPLHFPLFQFEDVFRYHTYTLVGNTCRVEKMLNEPRTNQLFQTYNSSTVTKYLIPEYKNVDYFLKIETENLDGVHGSLLPSLVSIPQIVTAYAVERSSLKSKNNLIFE